MTSSVLDTAHVCGSRRVPADIAMPHDYMLPALQQQLLLGHRWCLLFLKPSGWDLKSISSALAVHCKLSIISNSCPFLQLRGPWGLSTTDNAVKGQL